MGYIYGLFDPQSSLELSNCRYVGQTSGTIRKRLNEHISESRRETQRHVYNWIRSLLSEGVEPIIVLIEEISSGDQFEIDQAERRWISKGQSDGWRLTNHNGGGSGNRGYVPTEDHRIKVSAANKGRLKSESERKKLSDALMGREISESARAAVREKHIERFANDPSLREEVSVRMTAFYAAEDKTLTMCECGAGPFKGPRALNLHIKRALIHSDNPQCHNGHPWTDENTYKNANGKRECRICKRESKQARNSK